MTLNWQTTSWPGIKGPALNGHFEYRGNNIDAFFPLNRSIAIAEARCTWMIYDALERLDDS